MRVITRLILAGWNPEDPEYMVWSHPEHKGVRSFFEVAASLNIMVPHAWDRVRLSCAFCGVTQYRVFVLDESPVCMGVPDAKAFQDQADLEKLSRRISEALGGEEGMLWDKNED